MANNEYYMLHFSGDVDNSVDMSSTANYKADIYYGDLKAYPATPFVDLYSYATSAKDGSTPNLAYEQNRGPEVSTEYANNVGYPAFIAYTENGVPLMANAFASPQAPNPDIGYPVAAFSACCVIDSGTQWFKLRWLTICSKMKMYIRAQGNYVYCKIRRKDLQSSATVHWWSGTMWQSWPYEHAIDLTDLNSDGSPKVPAFEVPASTISRYEYIIEMRTKIVGIGTTVNSITTSAQFHIELDSSSNYVIKVTSDGMYKNKHFSFRQYIPQAAANHWATIPMFGNAF